MKIKQINQSDLYSLLKTCEEFLNQTKTIQKYEYLPFSLFITKQNNLLSQLIEFDSESMNDLDYEYFSDVSLKMIQESERLAKIFKRSRFVLIKCA